MGQILGVLHGSASSIIKSALPKLRARHRDEGGSSHESSPQIPPADGSRDAANARGSSVQERGPWGLLRRKGPRGITGGSLKSEEHTGTFEKVVLRRIPPEAV